jgi:hypothetical protein
MGLVDRPRQRWQWVLLAACVALVAGVLGGRTGADFSSTAVNPGNTFTAAAEFGPPPEARAAVASAEGADNLYKESVLADSPIAYWRLDEAPNTMTMADSSGNGRNGTYPSSALNHPTAGRPSAVKDSDDRAVKWENGFQQGNQAPHTSAFQLNGSFSIELWIRVENQITPDTPKFIIDKDFAPDANGWRFQYDLAGVPSFVRNNTTFSAGSTGQVRGTAFRHLVVSYDGAAVRWYVDGSPTTTTATTFPTSTGIDRLSIIYARPQLEIITLDEIALYNAALAPTRVSAHYAAAQGTFSASPDVCRPFRVYASVPDYGSPPSGISSVTANLSAVSSGATAVPLTAGSYTVGGLSYNYRSDPLRVAVATGSYAFSVTSVDGAGTHVQSGLTATVAAQTGITPTWLTGFEHDTAATPDVFSAATTGTSSASGAAVHSGLWARYVNKTAGASVYVAKNGFTTFTVLSFAVRLGTLPSADVTSLVTFNDSATPLYLGYQASTRKLTLRWGANTAAVATSEVTAGTWYTVDMEVDVRANPNTARWQLDGVAQPGVNLAAAAQTVTDVRFGSAVSGDVFGAHVDDIVHSKNFDDYPIGPVRILGSRPNGMGTTTNPSYFQNEDGSAISSTSYQRLNDTSMTTLNSGVRQVTVQAGSYVELTLEDVNGVCLRGAQAVSAHHKTDSALNVMRTWVHHTHSNGRQLYAGDSIGVNTLSLKTLGIFPWTNAWTPWTVSEFNSLFLRVGFSSDVTPQPYWDAFVLEYVTSP